MSILLGYIFLLFLSILFLVYTFFVVTDVSTLFFFSTFSYIPFFCQYSLFYTFYVFCVCPYIKNSTDILLLSEVTTNWAGQTGLSCPKFENNLFLLLVPCNFCLPYQKIKSPSFVHVVLPLPLLWTTYWRKISLIALRQIKQKISPATQILFRTSEINLLGCHFVFGMCYLRLRDGIYVEWHLNWVFGHNSLLKLENWMKICIGIQQHSGPFLSRVHIFDRACKRS